MRLPKLNKKQLIITGVIAAVIIALTITLVVIKSKNNDSDSLQNGSSWPLKYGDKGTKVRELQELLNKRLSLLVVLPFEYNGVVKTSITVDGVFGSETQAAVKWAIGEVTVSESQFNKL